MALISADSVLAQISGFGSLPILRQLVLMIGLAASVALGVTVAMWSQTPNYSMLYNKLSAKDMANITQALDGAGISYKLEQGSSGILVPSDKLYDARMKLATLGTPIDGDVGYELLDKEQGFGSSNFIQKARYHRALEGELAQSISKLSVVDSARVHIAIPKQSVFARQNSKPTVSVMLSLHSGRVLDDLQVAGIVSMVASSVPELDAEQVTIIDQKGRLLSNNNSDSNMQKSSTQLEYTRRLEERYMKRITDIVAPIIGEEGVRAQVVAEVDFTAQEQTRESYLPEQKAIRSEQVSEEINGQLSAASGIPGALSNQPPLAGSTQVIENELQNTPTGSSSTRAVRNYEVDRTISHTRQSPATLKKLSVAVIVDYRSIRGKKNEVTKEPLTTEDMDRIKSLVREAVGLNEARGDTINVVNTPFQVAEQLKPLPELPLWEQPWVLDLSRQLLGGLAVLLIAFGILRPMLRNLSSQSSTKRIGGQPGGVANMTDDQLLLSNRTSTNVQQLKEMVTSMAHDDPKRVAQVMNTWVASDG